MSRSRLVDKGLVASSMVSGGVACMLQVQATDGFVRLGYPLHFVALGEQMLQPKSVAQHLQVCPIRFGLAVKRRPH